MASDNFILLKDFPGDLEKIGTDPGKAGAQFAGTVLAPRRNVEIT